MSISIKVSNKLIVFKVIQQLIYVFYANLLFIRVSSLVSLYKHRLFLQFNLLLFVKFSKLMKLKTEKKVQCYKKLGEMGDSGCRAREGVVGCERKGGGWIGKYNNVACILHIYEELPVETGLKNVQRKY